MKKTAVSLILSIVIILAFASCAKHYSETDFLGKSSAEIVHLYGDFDCVTVPVSEDGLYKSCRCGYTTDEPKVGPLGTSPEKLFFIIFDSNGIAIACEEGYRPG